MELEAHQRDHERHGQEGSAEQCPELVVPVVGEEHGESHQEKRLLCVCASKQSIITHFYLESLEETAYYAYMHLLRSRVIILERNVRAVPR